MSLRVEICVQGVPSALAAFEGGADRVELCENLAVGGVTPSIGAIGLACERLAIPVHVLIRPRGGLFVFDPDEAQVMRRDVAACRELGVAGVVIGALRPDHTIDRDLTAALLDLAGPMSVTFHRAFDQVADPFAALDLLLGLGIDRILTSAGAPSAREALPQLADLQQRAGASLTILAAGRVSEADVPALAASGLRELHAGSSVGPAGATDPARVRGLVTLAHHTIA
jgi:copper homeostasis protein